MRVIINADDFGHDQDTVRATIDCFQRGILKSATIMPNMPASAEAVAFAIDHPEFSFGVHLTYAAVTVERPLCDPRLLPTLTDATGRFMTSNKLRLAALLGDVSVADIARETTAQLMLIHKKGIRISHVDSHGHLHKFAPFQRALDEVLPQFGIRRVRCVQNVYMGNPFLRPTYWLSPLFGRRLRRRFVTTDYMYMSGGLLDKCWWKDLQELFGRDGDLEVGIHPGYGDGWRRSEMEGADCFCRMCQRAGVQLISWNEVC